MNATGQASGLTCTPDSVVSCESYGVFFRVRVATPDLLAEVIKVLPHGSVLVAEVPAGAEEFTFSADSRTRKGFESSLEQLRQDLMVHVANSAPDHVFVHAGVVAWQGHGLMLPGESFAGKTTLVAELVRAGALYYSDEYAVIDQEGKVHPYARNLQVRMPGYALQTDMPVTELEGIAGTRPLSIALVAFVKFSRDEPWMPDSMTAGMSVLEMLRHTIPVQRTPARVMATLTSMLADASVIRSKRGEAGPAAHALLKLLEFHAVSA
ncbi:HPr kinase/phosphorylase [Granulicella tundricola]|uniref:HPr kinase n=1 Tax=Granulicella tundricola (strain ATCC BAA-1859 / DSM 23138 / MP5ACTX9) TaxID=1198114 RepID=E8X2I7_GRATM|nr:hypothetical protein [Granulicella tundricola]ADW69211.1 hypothetical protein AciX9_2167 [Granulicella tundricola MP5ACTX9]